MALTMLREIAWNFGAKCCMNREIVGLFVSAQLIVLGLDTAGLSVFTCGFKVKVRERLLANKSIASSRPANDTSALCRASASVAHLALLFMALHCFAIRTK